MAKYFECFSCVRSSTEEHNTSYLETRDAYDQAESQHRVKRCVANFRVFESRELLVATDGFNPGRFLGEGRSGRVYKGILEDGQEVAVKRFDEYAEADDWFMWKEVHWLSCIEHPNHVKMIGFSDNGKDCFIVYEYMPLRSLDLHLHDLQPGQKPLDWKTRMKIAHGVAKALEYLHTQKDPPVIYGGLKPTGILLDESYNPKLSDFGCVNHVFTSNQARESKLTYGYAAPEYPITGRTFLKSDIYCFGVVLLVLISGRKAIDITRTVQYVVTW
ncbi:hypothetical protein MKW94_006027, partial [Papaver nudicaule]|nr:hypothetical protein [Papaver nudicaule]